MSHGHSTQTQYPCNAQALLFIASRYYKHTCRLFNDCGRLAALKYVYTLHLKFLHECASYN